MSQMYHMMHGNQGNQEIRVLHGEGKGNLHLHIQIIWSRWAPLPAALRLFLFFFYFKRAIAFMCMHLSYMHH